MSGAKEPRAASGAQREHLGKSPPASPPKLARSPDREKDGNVVLYDMYVNGEWHGSRRTLEQCDLYFSQQ
jgi:hypothetical protein